jgi:AraC family transcriptional regulator
MKLVSPSMTPWQARCIRGYVAAHLHATIKVMDLARTMRWEPIQLNRAFKDNFGCTPHQYVLRRRIERAQNLLLLCNDPLGQIAAECGFRSRTHFSRLFRKTVGERPGAWRRLHMKPTLRAGAMPEIPRSGDSEDLFERPNPDDPAPEIR